MSTDDRPDILTRAYLIRDGRTTWWVEIAPTLPDSTRIDLDAMPFLGIDTQLPSTAQLYDAYQAASKVLHQAGWQLQNLGVRGPFQEWPIERIPPGPDGTQPPAAPTGEDGYLRRAGTAWQSHTPRITRRPSPVYLTAAAARRLIRRRHNVALPDGYDQGVLARIMAWTDSSSTEHVTLDERQAREVGQIARELADHHVEHLEVSNFGDEPWGVAGVLRALETGHSTPYPFAADGSSIMPTWQETTADADTGPEPEPESDQPWADEAPVDEQLDDLLVDIVYSVAKLLYDDGLIDYDETDEEEEAAVSERILTSHSAPEMKQRILDAVISRGTLLHAVQTGERPRGDSSS